MSSEIHFNATYHYKIFIINPLDPFSNILMLFGTIAHIMKPTSYEAARIVTGAKCSSFQNTLGNTLMVTNQIQTDTLLQMEK